MKLMALWLTFIYIYIIYKHELLAEKIANENEGSLFPSGKGLYLAKYLQFTSYHYAIPALEGMLSWEELYM